MSTKQQGDWCVFYCKTSDRMKWYTMKLWRNDGVLVSAKTYDDVYKFGRYKEAFDFAKNLITEDPPRYDVEVKRVCKARGNSFYLSNN